MNLIFPIALVWSAMIASVAPQEIPLTLARDWPSGFKYEMDYTLTQAVQGGWKMSLKFSKPVDSNLQAPRAEVDSVSDNDQVFCLRNRQYNGNLQAGDKLEMSFIGGKKVGNEAAPEATLIFHPGSDAACDMTPPPTVPPPSGDQEDVTTELVEEWPGHFKLRLVVLLLDDVRGGWKMNITFSNTVKSLKTPRAKKVPSKQKMSDVYYLQNRPHNAKMDKCDILEMVVIGTIKPGESAPTAQATFQRKEGSYSGGSPEECATTAPPTTTSPPTTAKPTTVEPSTEAPSTEEPSTEEPSTEAPSTEEPSTVGPTTEAPSTEEPSTEEPSTEAPSTEEPSTEKPSTEAPSTEEPSTVEPTTEGSSNSTSTAGPSPATPVTEEP